METTSTLGGYRSASSRRVAALRPVSLADGPSGRSLLPGKLARCNSNRAESVHAPRLPRILAILQPALRRG